MTSQGIRISVVVPTFRRWDRLKLTLAALEAQTLPKEVLEVIVSDDGSADGTIDRLREYAAASLMNLVVVSGPNSGPAAARNRGLSRAQGEWVAMTDDDCIPEPDWLSQQMAFVEGHPDVAGVGGKVVAHGSHIISRYIDWTRVMLPGVGMAGQVQYLVTANAMFRRDLLKRLGGFDETYRWPGGEDPDLSFRAIAEGAFLAYNENAVVRHMHRESVRGTYRMFWHHGLGLGALQRIRGKLLAPSFRVTLRKQLIPGIRRAFKERTIVEALMFAYLECIRHWAFRKGVLAYGAVTGAGATSAN